MPVTSIGAKSAATKAVDVFRLFGSRITGLLHGVRPQARVSSAGRRPVDMATTKDARAATDVVRFVAHDALLHHRHVPDHA